MCAPNEERDFGMDSNIVMRTVITAAVMSAVIAGGAGAEDRIRPYAGNPYFWEFKGAPTLLLGGSDHDNLFNHPDVGPAGLESHLDLLAACGGNYVRNTMSSRGEGNPWPFAQDPETGLYNLDEMSEEYWQRFERFLAWTAERDIIVQIEVFDRFDYAQNWWDINPFNPKNNINYTAEESGLPEIVPGHAGQRQNTFFRSVPELENNTVILPYQEAFVDMMLSYSLPRGNVLYCISNETNEEAEWGAYWAMYIRNAAEEAGVDAHVTEMWDPWDLNHPMHRRTIDHPEIYTFIDISQNNHQSGQSHWDNAQAVRRRIADSPRPINNVKMYGGLTHGGSYAEGLRRMWRNALGGMASARFHRPGEWTDAGPPWGAGLSEDAQAYIRTTRYIMEEVLGWPNIEPDLSFAEIVVDPKGRVRLEKTHLVYTRDADGTARFYMNGEPVSEATIGGDLSSWDAGMRLGLASEMNGERPWQGTFHDVAIYNRALTAEEVADHNAAGRLEHLDGQQARYAFDEGDGTVIHDGSGQTPALDLHIGNADAVEWVDGGLDVRNSTIIATDGPAERLTAAMQDSNAFTLEAWITPATLEQSGPARIVTVSQDNSHRNATLGQMDNLYQVRLRTTVTSGNGLPGLETGVAADGSIGAARSTDGNRAAIFVTHGMLLNVDADALESDLEAEWFDPRTADWHDAIPTADGYYQPPSSEDWVLILR